MTARSAQLRLGLTAVRDRIAAAAGAAGREPASVTLVVVTKTFPGSDVAALARLGVRDVAESRHPEAADKVAVGSAALRWHFVGAVQTNKARAIARYADVVHSVDRERLVDALAAGAGAAGRSVGCLIQLSLDPPGAGGRRSGVQPDQVLGLAARIATAEGLVLRGVMGLAPLGEDPGPAFARLAETSARLREHHPDATWMSAGMSDDLEEAIAAGATHVRVGRAILGKRPPLR